MLNLKAQIKLTEGVVMEFESFVITDDCVGVFYEEIDKNLPEGWEYADGMNFISPTGEKIEVMENDEYVYFSTDAYITTSPGKRKRYEIGITFIQTKPEIIPLRYQQEIPLVDLEKAHQQFTGYFSHEEGDDLQSLIESMGLTMAEWQELLKGEYHFTDSQQTRIQRVMDNISGHTNVTT